MTAKRRSLGGTASVKGVGLHTGAECTLSFKAAEPGQGIVFRRTDLDKPEDVTATVANVSDVERRTSLGEGEARIQTVEHVLAALAAHDLDDVLVELAGPEPPTDNGSAEVFFKALSKAKPKDGDGEAAVYSIQTPFVVNEGEARYVVAPCDNLRLNVTIDVDHPLIGKQMGCWDVGADTFAAELARARTYGFAAEADKLRSKGLAQGATETNTVVLSDDGVIGNELIWPDEFVRHKAVDILGDL
ncbi:MAG: UDP-3-O-[3-hydroxymyristoyl] N-acetylglucosamine deacetylase, partial [Gemmatimonadota bacterium]